MEDKTMNLRVIREHLEEELAGIIADYGIEWVCKERSSYYNFMKSAIQYIEKIENNERLIH